MKVPDVADCGDTPGPIATVLGLKGVTRVFKVHDADVGGELNGPYTLKVTLPLTVEPLGFNVTVAVSIAEPPKAMVEGETFVDMLAVAQVVSAPSA